MLASNALQLGFGECTYQLLSRFQWIRTYHAMVATPLRIRDMLLRRPDVPGVPAVQHDHGVPGDHR